MKPSNCDTIAIEYQQKRLSASTPQALLKNCRRHFRISTGKEEITDP